MTAPDVLTASVRIAAAPADVFPYFTDASLIIQWLGEWADLSAEPGGTFAVDLGSAPVRGKYVELDPPNRLVFTWGVAGRDDLPPGSTTVEVRLTADGPETLVELFHHDLPAEAVAGHLEGWRAKLAALVPLPQSA